MQRNRAKKIASEVQRLLKETGISKRVLAEEAGISYDALRSSLSRPEEYPALEKEYLPKIANALEKKAKTQLLAIVEKLRRLTAP